MKYSYPQECDDTLNVGNWKLHNEGKIREYYNFANMSCSFNWNL